jgi:hypothetical protein
MVVYSMYAPGHVPRRLESRWCEINRHELDPAPRLIVCNGLL